MDSNFNNMRLKRAFGSELNYGCRLAGGKFVAAAKAKKRMVGTRRLELLTSTVSR